MKAAARDRSSLVVLAITALLVLPAGLTLRSVLQPAPGRNVRLAVPGDNDLKPNREATSAAE